MKISNVFRFFNTFPGIFLLYLIPILVIIFLPSPSRIAVFLVLFVLFLVVVYKNLSLALFHIYLFSFVMGEPLLTLEADLIQDFVYFETPVLLSIPIKISLRFVIFLFFVLSLLISKNPSVETKKYFHKNFLAPFLSMFAVVILVCFGQIFGSYKIRYGFYFFQSLEFFLVFASVLFFLTKNRKDSVVLRKIKNIFFSFVVFSSILEGSLSLIQFVSKNPTRLNIERVFEVSYVLAPETGGFRSPGTFGHPNYLGVISGMFLPYLILLLSFKKIKKSTDLILRISILLAFLGLFLSFSRWAWISFFIGLLLIFWARSKSYIKILSEFVRKSILRILICAFIIILGFTIAERFTKFSTLEGRVEVFKIAIYQMQEHPFWGVGPGNSTIALGPFRQNLEGYIYSLKGAHSTFLLIGAELGIPALIGYLIFIISLAVTTFKNRDTVKKSFLLSFVIVILVFLIASLAYPLYVWDPSIELFFISSALYVFSLSQKNPFLEETL